nr:hypothetical protein [Streptomyces sp. MH191]
MARAPGQVRREEQVRVEQGVARRERPARPRPPGDLPHRRALGQRLRHRVHLAALQRDRPAPGLRPHRELLHPVTGQEFTLDDQVGEQLVRRPVLEQPRGVGRGGQVRLHLGERRALLVEPGPHGGVPLRVGHTVDQQMPAVGAHGEPGRGPGQPDAQVLLPRARRGRHEDRRRAQRGEQPGRRLRDVRQGAALIDLDAQQPGGLPVGHGEAEGGGGVDEGAVEVAGDHDGGGAFRRGGPFRGGGVRHRVTALPSAPVAPRV